MPTYTPGPWRFINPDGTAPVYVISYARYGDGDPEQIAQIGGDIMSPADADENFANARLMAAAPDLLNNLRGTLWLLENATKARPDTRRAVIESAREAIERAGEVLA